MSDGAELLDDTVAFVCRFVALPTGEAAIAIALWIVHTHAVDAAESTPRLAMISPEKGSGKTRTLEVLGQLVPKPIHAVNISPAALFHLVAEKQPTLLLDEADTYLGNHTAHQHEDLRGLINAGHRRGATAYRGEIGGKKVKVREFPAYAACALAGIGDLPDTVLDRSIVIAMKRRAPNEYVEPFRERLVKPEADELRERISEWADLHLAQLRDAMPEMPEGLTDRAADVWDALLAIADRAGGHWPETARQAAVALNKARRDRDPTLGIQLLTDCRRVFTDRDVDRLTTETLIQALAELEESPWGDLRGKQLDARGLARRLRKYEVRPADHRFDEGIRKGYLTEDFYDAWQRYLVADVADVAQSQQMKETAPRVASPEANGHTGFLSIPPEVSLLTAGDAQQGQHAQPGDDYERPPFDESLQPYDDLEAEAERLLRDHADIAGGLL